MTVANHCRVIIRGGRVATSADTYRADVSIEDGRIIAIGEGLDERGHEVIDATGCFVMPGGVDPHTHFESPTETPSGDDFTSGTAAAAAGGTTTVIEFCSQLPGTTIRDALDLGHEKLARARPYVDVGFHMIVSDLDYPQAREDLADLCAKGVTSYKVFMAMEPIRLDDTAILDVMHSAVANGALVMVHAENGAMIEGLTQAARKAGHVSPVWHARTRPPLTETEAVSRAIALARVADAPLYLVHLTLGASLTAVSNARREGASVWGEVCTQHLVIDESYLTRTNGELFVFTPPPRAKDEQRRLWEGIRNGIPSVFASDHAAWTLQQKREGAQLDFTQIPNGGPGAENRMSMIYHRGVRTGTISINEFVSLTSTNAARLFGLYPKKGTIAAGSDGDIVVWNPDRRRVFSAATEQSRAGYSFYEDQEVVGAPEHVLRRGELLVTGGRFVAREPHGEFLPRRKFDRAGIAESYRH
jgi:dihydropyrimidinase